MNLILGLDKGAVDYLIKPFSAQELIIRIRANIDLSLLRRKIILKQCKQEEINQLLLSISTELFSSSNIKETLHYIAEEIFHRIPCERIIIISNEQDEFKNNKILALFEDSANPFVEISDTDRSESQIFTNSQVALNNNSGITISLDVYCEDIRKNVSILSVKILLNNCFWGWIKIYRPSNSVWFDSEIEMLQQISNQISLAITYRSLLDQNNTLEIQIKAAEIANNTKGQILANTSHELRTPLGAIVGMLPSFEGTNLTVDQRDMINIMARASDVVLSIINNILDAAKLEAQKITLVNRTFDLLELFDDTIEMFGEKTGSKKIELIINYDVDKLPRYVKSDPERIKFTEQGEIILTISMPSCEVIDGNNVNPTNNQIINKGVLLIELSDTGIGMDPEYIQHAWKSFSRGDMSITRRQDGTGLGLSICKSLIEINGGEINAESQLGKGSKFWFTWNIELLSSMTTSSKFKTPFLSMQFNEQLIYILPLAIRQKRILIIHPVEMMRNVILNYLKNVEKVDAFDTFDKAIRAAKAYKESHYKPVYDIAFIGLNENTEDVVDAALELRGLEMNGNNLVIIFIAFPSNEGNELAKRLIGKVGGSTFIIYTPITWKKLINQFMHMGKNETTYENNMSMHIDENILKRVRDYGFHKMGNKSQEIHQYTIGRDFKRKCTSGKDFSGKCILCVDNDFISLENTLQQVSKLGYSTISSTSGQEAVRLIDSEFNILNNAYSSSSNLDTEQVNSCRISLILLECNLPIMSGIDVSRAIRTMRSPISNIPIIILTNLLTEEIQNKCIELGINDFLEKPLKIKELEKVLTKLD
ncbi:protein-histidine kinase [Gigaspora margarita]|uniref:Protein-histidine kinase n=1 Tax=Gigaspora margarita TaxID=4874 RepID=A0A8H4ELI4_GIGMA|nr:protein-histidine kinase [Gigaspora margarita]